MYYGRKTNTNMGCHCVLCNAFSQLNIILTLDSAQPYIMMYSPHRKYLDNNKRTKDRDERKRWFKG